MLSEGERRVDNERVLVGRAVKVLYKDVMMKMGMGEPELRASVSRWALNELEMGV